MLGAHLELPGLDSNQDKENQNPNVPRRNHQSESTLSSTPPSRRSAGCSEMQGEGGIFDPDLAALVAAWPTLPEPIRRAMMALVGASGRGE